MIRLQPNPRNIISEGQEVRKRKWERDRNSLSNTLGNLLCCKRKIVERIKLIKEETKLVNEKTKLLAKGLGLYFIRTEDLWNRMEVPFSDIDI